MIAIVLAIWIIYFIVFLFLLLLHEILALYIEHLDRRIKKLRKEK